MENARITVATITLNDVAGLRRTVESVFSQDYPIDEFIVVDGGSKDGTKDYMRSVSKPGLTFISEPDDGVADAFNKCLRLASGDSLIFLNAGDSFVDGRTLSRAVAAIPADCVIQDSILYGDYYQMIDGQALRCACDHRSLLSTCSINHQSVFIGRAVYKRFQFDTRFLVEMDYDFWLRCLRANVPFIKLDVPIAKFSLGGMSSGLKLRLHIYLMRFFLLAIQRRRRVSFVEVARLFAGACVVQLTTTLRGLLGRRLIGRAKQLLRVVGLKRRPDFELK